MSNATPTHRTTQATAITYRETDTGSSTNLRPIMPAGADVVWDGTLATFEPRTAVVLWTNPEGLQIRGWVPVDSLVAS